MKILIPLSFIFLFSGSCYAQWNYPSSKIVDSSDTYFGVTYKDPYRWLEYIKQPEVETWFKQQADYTNSLLDKLKGRDELIEEWKKIRPTSTTGI
jgi:prolyl oligopeptidase